MAGQQDKLREDAQFRILRLLHENPEMSQRELAKAVGISAGSVHYVINALVEEGLVKLGNFTKTEDKRRYAYILTRAGIAAEADLTRRFLGRKMAEYEALRAEIDSICAELDRNASSNS
jgi:EPS-associated MarR family transcriptional regulator